MTARQLLAELRSAGVEPAVDGIDLVFDGDIPHRLEPYVEVLQTGLRALLLGRRWFGIDEAGHGVGPGIDGTLDPAARLPNTVVLLIAGGAGETWDRVTPRTMARLPDAFCKPPPKAKRKWTKPVKVVFGGAR